MVGIKRGALQKKIRAGELSTFEGMLELNELLRVYPNVEVENSAMIEQIDRFIENALNKITHSNARLPDARTLLTRVSVLGQELAAAKAEVARYAALVDQLKPRVAALDGQAGDADDNSVRAFRSWFLHALEGRESGAALPARLLAREAFMRVMAAHVRLTPSGHEFFVEGSDNLLEAGLRSGLSLPYGCNDTSCGECSFKLVSGQIRSVREPKYRLSDDEVADGQILGCCCAAVTDVVLDVAEARSSEDIDKQIITAQVSQIETFPDALVVQAHLADGRRLRFLAGQYVQLQLEDGSSADCAVASCPCDERSLEFHLSTHSNPGFWRHASEQLHSGEMLTARGPRGDFVLNTESGRPLVFVAFDAGFGAIKSLIEHAMALDAAESIHLYRPATAAGKPYLDNLCRAWADALDEFSYCAVTVGKDADAVDEVIGAIVKDLGSLSGYDVYVCAPQAQLDRLGMALEKKAGALDRQVVIEPVRFS